MKIILACSLLIGLASGYFGQQWAQTAVATKASLDKVKKEGNQAKASLAAIEGNLQGGSTAVSLDALIPELMLDIFNQRTSHGVSISVVTPMKTGGAQMPSVQALAEQVPGSSLKSVALKMSGTYKSYPEFLEYLKLLALKPVAISRLKLQEQNFEVTLRAFGVLTEPN